MGASPMPSPSLVGLYKDYPKCKPIMVVLFVFVVCDVCLWWWVLWWVLLWVPVWVLLFMVACGRV